MWKSLYKKNYTHISVRGRIWTHEPGKIQFLRDWSLSPLDHDDMIWFELSWLLINWCVKLCKAGARRGKVVETNYRPRIVVLYLLHLLQGAERRGNEFWASYDIFRKKLLSKLKIGRAEKKISPIQKKFFGWFFFLNSCENLQVRPQISD